LLGADTLIGNGGDDVLYGGPGNDHLDGGAGNDRLFGDQGSDKLLGGPGNDVIRAVDHRNTRDVVRCGAGKDTVFANKNDRVDKSCERVTRKP
jgi:Ca2+-binding RTX toxin-like protein